MSSNDLILFICFPGDPLYVGFDLTIASFDSISEVSMVSCFKFVYVAVCTLRQDEKYCMICNSVTTHISELENSK